MSEKVYPVPPEWTSRAWIDETKYQEMYKRSIDDPDGFWGEIGKRIDWIKPYTKVKNTSFGPGDVSIKWFEDGTLNVCANCIDRHLAKRGDQVAIIWEGDDPTDDEKITYRQLHERVCRFANVLKANGVKKGDRVTIYLPMIPEAAYAMLACARIGAVHSVVFGGFSPDSLAGRINDAKSKFVITADEGVRGGRAIPLKKNTDEALQEMQGRREGAGGAAHRQRRALDRGPRRLAARGARQGRRRLPASRNERGGPAVHPLHLRLDRQTQGCAAHHRRLSRLRLDDPPVRVRLPRWGHLLVHRRRRLGHGPQLHSLRPALQRRHDADVRRRAELSDRLAVLACDRQVEGQHLLHRADRHPRADGRRR